MTQHRVHFVQGTHLFQHGILFLDRLVDQAWVRQARDIRLFLAAVHELHGVSQDGHAHDGILQVTQLIQFCHQLLFRGQKLVDGRIQQTNGHRQRCHGLENSLEVLALNRQQLVQCRLPVGSGLRNNHFNNDRQPFHIVEHPLGTAQTDTHGTVFKRPLGIVWCVGIGHDLEAGGFISPAQQRDQFRGKLGLDHWYFAEVDVARGAIEGNQVAFADGLSTDKGLAHLHVDMNTLGSRDTGFAHAACHDCRVRRLATTRRQNTL